MASVEREIGDRLIRVNRAQAALLLGVSRSTIIDRCKPDCKSRCLECVVAPEVEGQKPVLRIMVPESRIRGSATGEFFPEPYPPVITLPFLLLEMIEEYGKWMAHPLSSHTQIMIEKTKGRICTILRAMLK